MARQIRTFTVLPHLPERLQPLQKLAYNMWWCWNHEAIGLFRRIDTDLFETVEHSPVKMLGAIAQTRLEQLLQDDGFLAHMDRVESNFDNYMASTSTWFQESYHGKQRNGAGRTDGATLPIRGFGRVKVLSVSRPIFASRTSAPSSASTRACRSTAAASASSAATTSRAPATSACPSSASA